MNHAKGVDFFMPKTKTIPRKSSGAMKTGTKTRELFKQVGFRKNNKMINKVFDVMANRFGENAKSYVVYVK